MVMDADARAVLAQVLAVARKLGRPALSTADQAASDTTLMPCSVTMADVRAANAAIAAATAALAATASP